MQLFSGLPKDIQVSMTIKPLLWLSVGIGALLAVLMALLFLADINLYRNQIEQHVSTAFGREVILEGPLSLEPSLTPRFAVNGLGFPRAENHRFRRFTEL